MTNYERIKNMAIEEMVDLIDNFEERVISEFCSEKCCENYRNDGCCSGVKNGKCHRAIVKWLQTKQGQTIKQIKMKREKREKTNSL